MENNEGPLHKRGRGRPRKEARREIVDQLMDVTERLLQNQSQFLLTEQRIAEEADTTKAMIHYYFGDKDGLLSSIIARYGDEVAEKLKALDTIDAATPSIPRRIFEILIDAYYIKPWLAKVASSELSRSDSPVREMFIKRYSDQGFGMVHLQRLFRRLGENGMIDPQFDIRDEAWGFFSIVVAPMWLIPHAGSYGVPLSRFQQPDWIDYAARLFEPHFGPPGTWKPARVR